MFHAFVWYVSGCVYFSDKKNKKCSILSLMIFTQLYNYDKMYINLFLLCLLCWNMPFYSPTIIEWAETKRWQQRSIKTNRSITLTVYTVVTLTSNLWQWPSTWFTILVQKRWSRLKLWSYKEINGQPDKPNPIYSRSCFSGYMLFTLDLDVNL